MGIGEQLTHTRKAKGISIEAAEEATKIRAKFLRALENEEFEVLPGRVYAKAFLRSYARYLELDDAELAAVFDQLCAEEPEAEDRQRKFEEHRTFNWGRYVNFFAVVAVIGLLAAFNAVYGKVFDNQAENKPAIQDEATRPAAKPRLDTPPAKADENPGAASQLAQGNTPAGNVEQGLSVKLNVTSDRCWMRVVTDGTVAFEGELRAGEQRSFQASSAIRVKLGNAGAVEVFCNGQNFGYLGSAGQVVTKEFSSQQESPTQQG